mgnify:FL=1
MDKSIVHVASIIAASAGLGIVASFAAIAQGLAAGKAVESIARQPEVKGPITQALVLALAFIESLTLYALLIAIVLIFANPFK